MTFVDPLLLVLGLLVVAACAVLYVLSQRRRGARQEAFASPAFVPAVAPRRPRWRRHVPIALYLAAAAALAVAVAKPEKTVAVPVEQASIMLVTDHSRSMTATDIAPDRLSAARDAADKLLDQVPKGVKVGAVGFNQRARLLQAPTTDRAAVRDALAGLTAQGGTATGEGVFLGLASVRPPALPGTKPAPAALVLLTDGKASNGRDVLEVARPGEGGRHPRPRRRARHRVRQPPGRRHRDDGRRRPAPGRRDLRRPVPHRRRRRRAQRRLRRARLAARARRTSAAR